MTARRLSAEEMADVRADALDPEMCNSLLGRALLGHIEALETELSSNAAMREPAPYCKAEEKLERALAQLSSAIFVFIAKLSPKQQRDARVRALDDARRVAETTLRECK